MVYEDHPIEPIKTIELDPVKTADIILRLQSQNKYLINKVESISTKLRMLTEELALLKAQISKEDQ